MKCCKVTWFTKFGDMALPWNPTFKHNATLESSGHQDMHGKTWLSHTFGTWLVVSEAVQLVLTTLAAVCYSDWLNVALYHGLCPITGCMVLISSTTEESTALPWSVCSSASRKSADAICYAFRPLPEPLRGACKMKETRRPLLDPLARPELHMKVPVLGH